MFISVLCDWSSPINTDDTDNDNIYCETNVNEESWWRSKGMQWEPGTGTWRRLFTVNPVLQSTHLDSYDEYSPKP